jgi:hypothetical protein
MMAEENKACDWQLTSSESLTQREVSGLEGSSLEGAPEASAAACKHLGRARPYQFRRDASDPLCLVCAILYWPVLSRALYIALIVGTILTIINQGDVLLASEVTPLVVAKIVLTYAVPYSVSTFSALSANRVEGTA